MKKEQIEKLVDVLTEIKKELTRARKVSQMIALNNCKNGYESKDLGVEFERIESQYN